MAGCEYEYLDIDSEEIVGVIVFDMACESPRQSKRMSDRGMLS